MRIGALPATRKWKEVVRLIADGADATLQAAERAFAWVQEDVGFREASNLLTELAVAAGKPKAAEELARAGIQLQDVTSIADVALAVGEELDRRIDATQKRTDFGEMAGKALISAITSQLNGRLAGLFEPSRDDVVCALKNFSKKNEFGELAQSYFSNLTNDSLSYFLTKTLGTHVGEGQRFATTNQMAQFESALKTHCDETSVIAKEFSADWFSKHKWEEGGTISRKSVEGFAWYAMQKMRAELAMRAKPDGH